MLLQTIVKLQHLKFHNTRNTINEKDSSAIRTIFLVSRECSCLNGDALGGEVLGGVTREGEGLAIQVLGGVLTTRGGVLRRTPPLFLTSPATGVCSKTLTFITNQSSCTVTTLYHCLHSDIHQEEHRTTGIHVLTAVDAQ